MAAAGIFALEHMIERLEEDHVNARLLAEGLRDSGFKLVMESVQTNMVFLEGAPAGTTMEKWVAEIRKRDFLMNNPSSTGRTRLVTHHGVCREDILALLAATSEIIHGKK